LEKSKHWFTQSALAGDVFAANRLGHEAFQNDRGEEAIHWYQMAADKQDVDGEFNLGFCYESGMGTPINMKKAKYWYQRAALQGDEEAKRKLKEL
ncbi:MAG TPA: sel1 repeat family protein, partial [Rummeliibacillus sp.]|nr:sel1 repeat family protein [Rummeliibacillus sp.]